MDLYRWTAISPQTSQAHRRSSSARASSDMPDQRCEERGEDQGEGREEDREGRDQRREDQARDQRHRGGEEEKRRQERMRREGTRCHASPHRTQGALLVPEDHNRLQDFREVSTTSIHHSCISLGVFTAPKTWGARVGFPMGLTTLSPLGS